MNSILDSMCMTYRHDFGLLSEEEKEQTRNLLRGVYEWHVKPLEDDAKRWAWYRLAFADPEKLDKCVDELMQEPQP